MALESLLGVLIIGALAGWLAGLIVKGYGYGPLGNIVIGIAGAFVENLLLPGLGLLPTKPATSSALPTGHCNTHHHFYADQSYRAGSGPMLSHKGCE